jgi:hypothetical protein
VSEEPQPNRQSEYEKHREQSWTDRQASSDEFDKNLLKFSSGALGLSLAFIKDIVPLEQATWLPLLYVSWSCFSLCILATIASYFFSTRSFDTHLGDLHKYYVDADEKALNPSNFWTNWVRRCAVIAGIFFIAGFVCTVVFVSRNIAKGHLKMQEKKSLTFLVQEGRTPVPMTAVQQGGFERGRSPVPMTPHSQGNTPSTPAQSQQPATPVKKA